MKNLKFDINAFVLVEQVTGLSISQLIEDEKNMSRISTLRALFWAARIHETPELSLAEAGKEMQEALQNGQGIIELSEAISKAILDSGIIPSAEEVEELEPENPPAAPSVKA